MVDGRWETPTFKNASEYSKLDIAGTSTIEAQNQWHASRVHACEIAVEIEGGRNIVEEQNNRRNADEEKYGENLKR